MRSYTVFVSVLLLLLGACATATSVESATVSNKQVETDLPRSYTGWVALKKQTIDPTAGEDDWISMRDIKVTDEGEKVKILDEGKETGYSVQLIEITYEKTNVTVLKLGVIEDAKDYTRAYAWAHPGAKLLGINVRWVQTGFTLDK